MITLYITSLNEKGFHQEFSFGPLAFEAAFIFLNNLVNNGCTLFSVYYLTRSGGFTPLPVEAFDGQPMSDQLKQLEQEWQAILH